MTSQRDARGNDVLHIAPICKNVQLLNKLTFSSAPVLTRKEHSQLRRQPSSEEDPGDGSLQSHPGPQQRGERPHGETQSVAFYSSVCRDSDEVVLVGSE